ncbi:MAG TPA: DoxX family protein [Steroidobacteraceae bacterium]|nr:DoxX family protein [Steroidobacteraceae bacterium]
MRDWLLLQALGRYGDFGLLAMRTTIGAFLVWGVWDNITDATAMNSFVLFLKNFQFPNPELLARVSVAVQFVVGLGFVLGLFTRWAGIFCAVNFGVALAMVDRLAGMRAAFPSICLIVIGGYLALRGAGFYGIDTWLERRGQDRER